MKKPNKSMKAFEKSKFDIDKKGAEGSKGEKAADKKQFKAFKKK